MRAVTRSRLTAWAAPWAFGLAVATPLSNASAQGAGVQAQPPRIVSLSSAITEVLYALGAGEVVVAVAQGVTYPAAAARKVHVGPARTVTAEPVLAQRPSLVLGDTTVPAATVQQLRAAGVTVELLPGDAAANVTARVRRVGALIGRPAEAARLADSLTRELNAVAALPKLPGRVLFIYARSTTTAFVSGSDTGADEMITMAGAVNAVRGFSGYRPMTAESVVAAAPDVIVVPARGLASVGGVPALLRLPGVAQTPAARTGRIVAIDDQLLLSFGPRTAQAVRELRAALQSRGDAVKSGAPASRQH